MDYYVGVEGGATFTKAVVITHDAKILNYEDGPGTNLFLIGLSEAVERVAELISRVISTDKLPNGSRCKAVGLALSGAEDSHINKEFTALLKECCSVSDQYFLTADANGTIVTAFETGGVSLIAGTGSSCRLLNSDGQLYGCGGWGHMIGDGGSAFWISLTAVRVVFDNDDGFLASPYDPTYVKQKAVEFFKLQSFTGILDHLYKNFDKSKFALFCKVLAEGATVHKDNLCKHLFKEAGRILARHVVTVAKHADTALLGPDKSLSVVTVGSVWKSFELLREGFSEVLKNADNKRLQSVCLFQLKTSTAVGAAFLGARSIDHRLPLDFSSHVEAYCKFEL